MNNVTQGHVAREPQNPRVDFINDQIIYAEDDLRPLNDEIARVQQSIDEMQESLDRMKLLRTAKRASLEFLIAARNELTTTKDVTLPTAIQGITKEMYNAALEGDRRYSDARGSDRG